MRSASGTSSAPTAATSPDPAPSGNSLHPGSEAPAEPGDDALRCGKSSAACQFVILVQHQSSPPPERCAKPGAGGTGRGARGSRGCGRANLRPPIARDESARPPARSFNKIPTAFQRCSPNLVMTIQRHSWAARTRQETTMHPTIMSDVAKDRIADWHRQADRARTARAARAARTKRARPRPTHLAVVLARRVRAALGAPILRRSAQRGQTRKATP
jgi:hypothetical protein